jgi:hypothetical protein
LWILHSYGVFSIIFGDLFQIQTENAFFPSSIVYVAGDEMRVFPVESGKCSGDNAFLRRVDFVGTYLGFRSVWPVRREYLIGFDATRHVKRVPHLFFHDLS